MSYIELKDIRVSYDKKTVILDKLNLSVEKGELVSFLGPSGCGKTTTLRVVAGLLDPSAGTFSVDGKDYTNVPIHKRNFGIVFQSYALFPHLTVEDNVAFGLKMRKIPREQAAKRAAEMLDTVDMGQFGKRYPRELSGGQRQRVALARALVVNPEILLLDEPLSNLDAKLRLKMRVEIRELQQKLGITTIFVTHDQEECFSISDKVAVMNRGVIEQYDSPERIYARPSTEFVARFVGFENFFGLEQRGEGYYHRDMQFKMEGEVPQGACKATIRPDDVVVLGEDERREFNVVQGKVRVRTYLGKSYQYKVETAMGDFVVNSTGEHAAESGETIRLYLPPNRLVLV